MDIRLVERGGARDGRSLVGFPDMDTCRTTQTAELWKEALRRRENEDEIETLRARTRTGRPLGSDRFVAKLEAVLSRCLHHVVAGYPAEASAVRKRE